MRVNWHRRPNLIVLAFSVIGLMGCAIPGLDARRHERPAAYAALSPEFRALVDEGKIANGMNSDAVYLAWGNPGRIVDSDGPAGRMTTWLYYGNQSETTYYSGYYRLHYVVRLVPYVRAKAVFQHGLVESWEVIAPGMLGG